MPGRILYDVGAADALAHWLAQHPHVVMLAGTIPFLSFWAERKVTKSWIGAPEPALAE